MSSPLSGTAAGVSALADVGTTVAAFGHRGAGYAFGVVLMSVSGSHRDGLTTMRFPVWAAVTVAPLPRPDSTWENLD